MPEPRAQLQFPSLLQNFPEPVFVLDAVACLVAVNRAAERLLGREAADLLGGSDTTMIGQTLWTEFFSNKDWPVASAVAVVLVVLLVGPIAIYQHLQARGIERS